jgi:hypothetical protein
MSGKYESNVFVKEFENPVTVEVEITDAQTGTYNLYTLSDIYLEPRDWFKITTGSAKKTMTILPNENLDSKEGLYTFNYILNYRDLDQKVDNQITINILKLENVLEIGSESVDSEAENLTFYVKNKQNVNLEGLSAEFSSLLFETKKEFDLKPYEKKEFTVSVDPDKLRKTKAGVYVIDSVFSTDKDDVKISGNLYLGEKKGIMTTEDKSGWIVRTTTVRKINSGNILENVEVTITKNIFSRLFTSFNVEPTQVERNGFTIDYIWRKDKLGPTEMFVVTSKTNYFFPLLIIIFIALVLFGIRRYSQTKIEVIKSVSPMRTKNDEFALKVRLTVKSSRSVENVSLIDRVPAIVKIYKQFGTVKPNKIDADSRRVTWNIGDLKAGEERVFSYIIYAKVGVVGKFSLPGALAVFEKDGNIHEVESNQVFYLNDQIKKLE